MNSVLSASTIAGDDVVNDAGENLGKIEEVMIDLDQGRIAYAVLSFGGFMGMGNKLFALPWDALAIDRENKRVVLNVPRDVLEASEGFDKSNWPDMADPAFRERTYAHYGARPYWN